MCDRWGSGRGFTFIELMFTVAVAATVLAMSVPVLTNVSEGSKLNGAAREFERELQAARLKAVTVNGILRVRTNCPADGSYRTVEFLGVDSKDGSKNRCQLSAYPFPAPDNDIMTRPNHDGPIRTMPTGTVVDSTVLEFHPDGRVRVVVSNVSQEIVTPVTVTVTRQYRSRVVTVNGAGKIQLAP